MTEADEALLWARKESWHPAVQIVIASGYRAGAAASAERIKELEARVAELEAALAKANEPEWFFLDSGIPYSSLSEAVTRRVDQTGAQTQVVKVDTGRPCKTIWAAVRILGPRGEWSLTPCATEAEARALLKESDQ